MECWHLSRLRVNVEDFHGESIKDWVSFIHSKFKDGVLTLNWISSGLRYCGNFGRLETKPFLNLGSPTPASTMAAFNRLLLDGHLHRKPIHIRLSFTPLHWIFFLVPTSTLFFINCDRAWHHQSYASGRGSIIWDLGGNFVAAQCSSGEGFSVATVEAQVIRESLDLANSINISEIVVYLDCQALVAALNGQITSLDWVATSLINEVLDLRDDFVTSCFIMLVGFRTPLLII